MRCFLVLALALAALAAVLPTAAMTALAANCPDVAPPALAFDEPTFIERTRAGGEPVSIVAQDGSINVSAHAGTTHVYKDDRRLGDFFTVNDDKDGSLFIVSGDTTLRSPTGGPKPVGNPIFIKQSSGAPLLEQPMAVRKTRCLFPLPSC